MLQSLALWFCLIASVESEEFIVSLKRGDEKAFRRLFDLYHADLYRFLLRSGVSSEGAEDILQDIFAGVWSGRFGLDATRSIRAYLYRACRNRAANYFRSRSRISEALPVEPSSTLPSPEEQLDYASLLERLNDAVLELPKRRRAVFELCFMNGLSYKEAADVLDISVKTVENHMGYAFKTIRERLAPYMGANNSKQSP